MIDIRPTEAHVLDHVTRTIVEHLRPRRIVLFGSRARGDARDDSDYDIMVELETDLDSTERRRAVAALFPDRTWGLDVLVYTADEVRRWRDDVGFVLYDIVREGRVLYCRPDVVDGDIGRSITPDAPRVRERPGDAPESLDSWIDRAREDLAVMQVTAGMSPPALGSTCFHAQQSAEKLLKACLISKSVKPPRTHGLAGLLDLCARAGFDLEHLRPACSTLDSLWEKSRYPEKGNPTSSDAQAAVEAASLVREVVLPLLERAG